MPSLVSALSALAVISFALATPIWRANLTFTIYEAVPMPFVPGPVLSLQIYQKYGVTPPPEVLAAAAAAVAAIEDGTVAATPSEYDFNYLSPVTVGGQTLDLKVDTGSADLWVFSSEMPSSQSAGHHIYDPSMSSTAAEMDGYTWSITYLDESYASGNVYQDTVEVGGTIVTAQAVELAEDVSPKFVTGPFDGILGAAFAVDTIQPYPQNTFFENAINAGLDSVFTADLKKGIPGSYDFGFIDNSKFNGEITYVDVDTNGQWEFTYSGYAVGDGQIQGLSSDAVMDTGASLLYLDELIADAYYEQVPGAVLDPTLYAWTFPCSAPLPSLTLSIGGYNAVVPGTYMNSYPVTPDVCYGGLQNDTRFETSIIGDIFIKSQFIVFDLGNLRLGLAAKNLP